MRFNLMLESRSRLLLRFASAPCVPYPYILLTITHLHQLHYPYHFAMFSPLMAAEFPTYDQAFEYTQAYAIEDGIGLTKKHTNFRQKGGPVRNQDLCFDRGSYQANRVAYQPVKENRKRPSGSAQTACEYAVRIQYLARGVYKVQEKGFTNNHEPIEGAPAHPSGRRLPSVTRRISAG